MDEITLKALAKINLGLDVVRRREDGYHEVRMIMQTIHLYDLLEIQKIREPEIQIASNLSFLPVNENNLVYKAARLLQEEFALTDGISVKLTKRIPVAAGMAGGSTDAAAMLYAMNQLYDLGLSRRELMKRGVQIGADVPYCLMRGTALAEGIGEKLTQLPPMIKCPVLIAKPSISVSTKFVYQNLKLDEQTNHPDIDALMNIFGVPVYVSSCAGKTYSRKKSNCRKTDKIAKAMIDKSRKEHKDSYSEFYTTECGVFIETYGRRATQRFIDFLYKEKISDLHTGNYGYDALGNLKIIDYSGFHDLDVF